MTDVALDTRKFRDVLGSYPTGVCVVTARDAEGRRLGLVVGSFTSISLDPPLVGFFPDKRSQTWPAIEQVGRFCVNVLGSHQLDLCRRFSAKGDDKFGDLAHGASPSGQPLLETCFQAAVGFRLQVGICNDPEPAYAERFLEAWLFDALSVAASQAEGSKRSPTVP